MTDYPDYVYKTLARAREEGSQNQALNRLLSL